jgi:hypothetical protein
MGIYQQSDLHLWRLLEPFLLAVKPKQTVIQVFLLSCVSTPFSAKVSS